MTSLRMTRRESFKCLAAALAVAPAAAKAETSPRPAICVYSGALAQVGYAELGEIAGQLGFDGVDLTVKPGGHVEPRMAPVDLVRAIESVQGAGLALPIITTALTTTSDPWCRTLLALPGRSGVHLFKCGYSKQSSLQQMRRDFFGLAYIGREYGISLAIPCGEPDQLSLSQVRTLTGALDSNAAGLAITADLFAPGVISDEDFSTILPRVKAVTAFDFATRQGGNEREWRSLGQGSVDFGRMFRALARGGYRGPITIKTFYSSKDEPGALARDAAFLRKQIDTIYSGHES